MWGSSSGTIPYLLTKSQAFCCLVLLFLLLVLSAISLAVSGAGKGGGGSTAALLLFGLEKELDWLILGVALRGAGEWMMDGLGLARVDDDFVFFLLLLGQVEKERLPVIELACIAEDENVGQGQQASISFRISRVG
jgi:hypothetical protein